jgi:uncharacterized BrkB/YihY/UPF0761 family membrane protein
MVKKIIFTLLWMVAGLLVVGILMGLAAPLFPKLSEPIDEHTSSSIKLTYFIVAQVPLVVAAVFLLLGIFGKLPGTKRRETK